MPTLAFIAQPAQRAFLLIYELALFIRFSQSNAGTVELNSPWSNVVLVHQKRSNLVNTNNKLKQFTRILIF